MDQHKKIYAAIDLKSYYASVECITQNLDPLTTNLVVADESKTEKTICLAVTPALKQYGIAGRARLFEVIQRVKEINQIRKQHAEHHVFSGSSYDDTELKANPNLELTFLAATPRMAYYIECSKRIYEIYLTYVSPEDIHVYSIDEVFIDITSYLATYHVTPKEFAKQIILDIYKKTGITATAGIGTNLYLCKVAMDIVAKHIEPDKDGVRIALLDEMRYRKLLWNHRPIRDFWRVGRGYAKKLEQNGLYTMGDIAKCSIGKADEFYNEELLYTLFGVNAELLIDHAWGYESCTMEEIKSYQPENNSIGTGQVLSSPYPFNQARLIVKEMLDQLALTLTDKALVCDQIILVVGYDIDNLKQATSYKGEITTDYFGRKLPKHAHGSVNLPMMTASSSLIMNAVIKLYDRIIDKSLTIRRINIAANHVISENAISTKIVSEQIDLFTDYEALEKQKKQDAAVLEREKRLQKATLEIKKKYGKNALLKGMNLEDGAKAIERNDTIGGHKA